MMTKPVRRNGLAVLLAGIVLVAACGGGGGENNDDAEPGDAPERRVLLEPVSATGPDPFTDSVAGSTEAVASTPSDGVIQRANAPGLYGGTGDQGVCDEDQLVAFSDENPDKAAAWADAQRIDPDEIGAYVESLTPTVLQHDTQVTNHGFADGVATPPPVRAPGRNGRADRRRGRAAHALRMRQSAARARAGRGPGVRR